MLVAGRLLGGRIDADKVAATLREFLDNSQYLQAAGAFLDHHRHFSTGQAIEHGLSLIKRTFLDC